MPKRARLVELAGLQIDRRSAAPLWKQVCSAFRHLIESNEVEVGERLPSHRALAAQLGVTRGTIVNAYEQLVSEGYIEGTVGSGTRVATEWRELRQPGAPGANARRQDDAKLNLSVKAGLSARVTTLVDRKSTSLLRATRPVPFRLGTPDFATFPHAVWRRLVGRSLDRVPTQLLMYSNTGGLESLRTALAGYLRRVRGVNCEADEIIITSGAQQAIYLCALALAQTGDHAWVENPGYRAARSALVLAGLRVHGVPVDKHGMMTPKPSRSVPAPRLLYVTPSHQYPLGVTMGKERRRNLLAFAHEHDSFVIEDDYVSEFRYAGSPLSALQGLPGGKERVAYIGTFSKVFFPALRVGFLVVPKSLVNDLVYVRSILGEHSSTVEHAALASFIADGHFERHILRMRKLYSHRRNVLEAALAPQLPKGWKLEAGKAGLHLIVRAPAHIDDIELAHQLGEQGIESFALSRAWLGDIRDAPRGLQLGFSGFTERQLVEGAATILKLVGRYAG